MKQLLHCLMGCVAAFCGLSAAGAEESSPVYQKYVVAADHPAASQAGLEVLEKGGNVVDAAVATSFALSVVRPGSCGIGGGGFMVIWNAEKQSATAVDYRERAPLAASRDMYSAKGKGKTKLSSRTGGAAAAIPGTVAGLYHVHQKYGKLPWPDLLAPAIRLAEQGVNIDEHDISAQRTVKLLTALQFDAKQRFAALFKDYLNGGKTWTTDDRFHSPQQQVLRLIAEKGRDGFYTGEVAEALISTVNQQAGIWQADDLKQMDAVERDPLSGQYNGDTIITMPPPSSGGVALLETLNILDAFEQGHPQEKLQKLGSEDPVAVHLVTEALKHAFADRAEFLGDTDFVTVPVKRLISREYAAALAKKIDPKKTQPRETYGRFEMQDDAGTSHFSILDAAGNAVACTETINLPYGSLVADPKYGVVLNNEMDDFAAVPGKPNAFGLMQSEANAIAPRKKPLSSMTPTIVVRDGKAIQVLGGSGGPRIISATLQVLLNLSRHQQNVKTAVSAPRFHHQWLPEILFVEPKLRETLADSIREFGHKSQMQLHIAAVQAAVRTEKGLQAYSDPRKGGSPAGR